MEFTVKIDLSLFHWNFHCICCLFASSIIRLFIIIFFGCFYSSIFSLIVSSYFFFLLTNFFVRLNKLIVSLRLATVSERKRPIELSLVFFIKCKWKWKEKFCVDHKIHLHARIKILSSCALEHDDDYVMLGNCWTTF